MSTWTVVYEQTETGWSAFVPALPGLGAAAATHEEAEQLIREAIVLHVQRLAEDGLPIPDPHSIDVGQVELPQPRVSRIGGSGNLRFDQNRKVSAQVGDPLSLFESRAGHLIQLLILRQAHD